MPPGSSINSPADFPFFITYINHHFRNDKGETQTLRNFSFSTPQSHSNCPTDNDRCDPDGWRGVALMRYTSPPDSDGKVVSLNCTATLLNNGFDRPDDRTGDVFLTAYHCIEKGSNPEMRVGTPLNATFRIGDSNCAPAGLRVTWAKRTKFIAGNEQGDYALLWAEDEPEISGGTTITLRLFGHQRDRLAIGSVLGSLHHGDAEGAGVLQDWAQVRITGYSLSVSRDSSISCSGGGCSHYDYHYELGGLIGGSSGSALWMGSGQGPGPDWPTRVNAVHTDSDAELDENGNVIRTFCSGSGSMFTKISEDGRVACTLSNGTDYLTDPATCNDDARPRYSRNENGNSTGGAVDPLTLLLLAAGFLGSRLYRRKSKQRISEL